MGTAMPLPSPITPATVRAGGGAGTCCGGTGKPLLPFVPALPFPLGLPVAATGAGGKAGAEGGTGKAQPPSLPRPPRPPCPPRPRPPPVAASLAPGRLGKAVWSSTGGAWPRAASPVLPLAELVACA
eukprot:scaffold3945_cov105-Isochrysis_galbana.AAC.13